MNGGGNREHGGELSSQSRTARMRLRRKKVTHAFRRNPSMRNVQQPKSSAGSLPRRRSCNSGTSEYVRTLPSATTSTIPASFKTRRCFDVWYWGTPIRSDSVFTFTPVSSKASIIRRLVGSARARRTSEHSEPCMRSAWRTLQNCAMRGRIEISRGRPRHKMLPAQHLRSRELPPSWIATRAGRRCCEGRCMLGSAYVPPRICVAAFARMSHQTTRCSTINVPQF